MTSSPSDPIRPTARPENEAALADLIRDANATRQGLVPVGGGTAGTVGNAAADTVSGIDLTGLAGITAYQPADLTLSVRAGTTLAEIRQALAAHGQELPVDLPRADQATIGGLVATGFAGPRRLRSGTLKDLLLGCTYVRGDGLLAKAGGSVVKNVSGFEIPRLLHGSWGSLAVITSLNFKVTPCPKAERTLAFDGEALEHLIDISQEIRSSIPSATAIEIDGHQGAWRLLVRLMGRPGAVRTQADELVNGKRFAETGDGEASASLWQKRADDLAATDGVQVIVSTRPRDLGKTMLSLVDTLPSTADFALSPCLGTARIRFDPASLSAADVAALITELGNPRFMIEFAPSEWKAGIDAWGTTDPAIGMMRALKQEFDPNGILNPGRLFI